MSKRANGDGTNITRHKSGKWWQRVTLPDGTRKAFYGDTQAEVRQKRDEYLAAFRAGRISTDAAQLTGKYLHDWLKSHKSVKPRTRLDYERQVALAAPIHSIRLDQLKPAHVQALYDELAERGLGPVSVQKVHRVLRAAFRRAVKLGYILRAPTELADPPRAEANERPTLNAKQVNTLLESTRGDRLHALWVTLLLQGLRSGEALGLRWTDIDFEAGRLTVRQTVQYLGAQGLVPGTPKTPRSRRTLDLVPATAAALREHRARQLTMRLAAPVWESRPEWQDLVFTTDAGKPIFPSSLRKPLLQALKRAGLPALRVHDLRHTYATVLCGAGCEIIHVQHELGHSSYHLTADTYTHVRTDRRSPATEHMERLFPSVKAAH